MALPKPPLYSAPPTHNSGRRWRAGSLAALALLIPLSLTAQPTVFLRAPSEVLLGETFVIELSFDTPATGFGPYIDLFLPEWGTDGTASGVDCDGITFAAVDPAAPLAAPITLPAPACLAPQGATRTHPFTGEVLDPTWERYQLVILQPTFPNVEPEAPPIRLLVTLQTHPFADARSAEDPADCEAPGLPLTLAARGGFRWGTDPLNNPQGDPPVVGALTQADTTPRVFTLGIEDPLSTHPGSCFDGLDNGGDGDADSADRDCGRKAYLGPEDETATGPSFPQSYQITVDVAAGQTLSPLIVTDHLPGALQFLQVTSVEMRRPPAQPSLGPVVAGPACGGPGVDYVLSSLPGPGPGGDLTLTFCSVTGTPEPDDVVITFAFFVPERDAAGELIIDPATCQPADLTNDAEARGRWEPLDTRDRPQGGGDLCLESDRFPDDHVLAAKCVATQKSVEIVDDTGAPGATPGDRLRYTLAVQVSDYYPQGDLRITDVLSDGQTFAQPPDPLLVVNGTATSAAGSLTVTPGSPACGQTTLTFDLSKQLLASALSPTGVVQGWAGALQFEAVIDDRFQCPPPAGDLPVDKHDPLKNQVRVGSRLYDDPQGNATGVEAEDDSASEVVIVSDRLEKSVYAIWRQGQSPPEQPPLSTQVAAGDWVTYRLRYTLPSCDAEVLEIRDFLPLPVLDVDRPVAGSSGWDWADTGVFDCSQPPSFPVPLSGNAQLGPDHTAPLATLGLPPDCQGLLASHAGSNSLLVKGGSPHGDTNEPCVIDLLYTLEVTCDPFADGLFLNNRAIECEGSSFFHSPKVCQEATAPIQYSAPQLAISKGVVTACCPPESVGPPDLNPIQINLRRPVLQCGKSKGSFTPSPVAPVAFSAPGSSCPRFSGMVSSAGLTQHPIHSQLSGGVDRGDLVTFAVVIENQGSSPYGAFDVALEDLLPIGPGQGFTAPDFGPQGINLCVTDGTGALLPHTVNGPLLHLELTGTGSNPQTPGSLDPYHPSSGKNLAVVTYDLRIAGDAPLGTCLENETTLTDYRAQKSCKEDEQNLAENGFGGVHQASTKVCLEKPRKSIAATSEAHTAGSDLAIGEIVRFRLEMPWPQGTTSFVKLIDTLPPGLALLDPTDPSAPPAVAVAFLADSAPGVVPDLAGAWPGVLPPSFPVPASRLEISGDPLTTGQTVTVDLGHLDNKDRDCDAETVVLGLNALVLNINGNDDGVARINRFQVQTGKKGGTRVVEAPPVTVHLVEPRLELTKKVISPPPNGDPGAHLTYQLFLTNTGHATAFDIRLSDKLPPCLELVPGTAQPQGAGGTKGVTLSSPDPKHLEVLVAEIPVGASLTITFEALLSCRFPDCANTTNRAAVSWTSLPGLGTDPNDTRSKTPGSSGALDGERTAGRRDPNDYSALTGTEIDLLCRPQPPDLVVAKAMSDGFLSTAGVPQWEYTLTVSNLGPGPTQGPITVTDVVPPGFQWAGGGGNGWSCAESPPGRVTCQHSGQPPLAPGGTMSVPVVIERTGQMDPWAFGEQDIENCAGIATPGEERTDNNETCLSLPCPHPDDPAVSYLPAFVGSCGPFWTCDPAMCREAAAMSDLCAGSEPPRQWFWSPCGCGCREVPDLLLSKEDKSAGAFAAGHYAFTLTNASGVSAPGPLVVTDTLPPGLVYQASQGDGWTCTAGPLEPTGQTVTCTHTGPLSPWETLELSIATQGSPKPEDYNCAQVKSPGPEASLDNNWGCTCPDPDSPLVHYLTTQVEYCDYNFCPPGQEIFFSACGCGCIGPEDPCNPLPWQPTVSYWRERPQGGGELRLRVARPEGDGPSSLETIRLDLPAKLARRADVSVLPAGWQARAEDSGLILEGPAAEAPVYVKLALPGGKPPKSLGLEARGVGGPLVERRKVPVEPQEAVEVVRSLQGLLALPPKIAPGEHLRLRPLDPVRTPSGGSWSLGGTVIEPKERFVTCWEPLPFDWQVPLPWREGRGVEVRYTDGWGDVVVDVESAEGVEVVSPPEEGAGVSTEDRGPFIEGGSELVLPGSEACVCGRFPDARSQGGLLFDGAPAGSPAAASPTTVMLPVPPTLAFGEHVVSGNRRAGYGEGEEVLFEVVGVEAGLDQERLFRGGSTQLELRVVGTERPLELRLQNLSPEVIRLEGGDDQRLTTAGGEENTARRTVRAVGRGAFDLEWTLELPPCPCGRK